MQTPEQIAEELFGQSISGNASVDMLLASFKSAVADCLRQYGAERARAERERIRQLALDIRADYSESVLPDLPVSFGARQALNRLLDALSQ